MKKLIYLIVLPLMLMASCKKADDGKLSLNGDVSFTFSPNNVPSSITFKNFQTGEVKTFTNQTSVLSYNYIVKSGDRYSMEMKGTTSGLNNSYTIRITYKNKVIESDRALGGPNASEHILKIDKTFHELDFAD